MCAERSRLTVSLSSGAGADVITLMSTTSRIAAAAHTAIAITVSGSNTVEPEVEWLAIPSNGAWNGWLTS